MATTTKKTNKSGQAFYEIRVHVSRDRPTFTKRWYPPKGWSQRTIDRELAKVAAEFERKIAGGEVLSREERKAQAAAEAAEAAKIQTFRQYGEQVFMPTKRISCAEKTRSYYQGALDNHLYPALGSFRLPEITSAQITAYFLQLKESGLAHSTIIGIYVTCNQLFKQAYMDETISKNPMDRVQRPRQRKEEQKKAVDAFTSDEVKHIISCLEAEPMKWRCFVRLLIETGIRRGEACALRWENIDLKYNSALIKENLCYTSEKGVYIDVTKTGRERVVYFSPDVSALLKAYRTEQVAATSKRTDRLIKDKQPLVFEKIAVPDYVFTEKGNCSPMHPDAPNRYLQKFSKKYEIDIHCHKLRHTFASLAITNGADIASVSEVLGHADKATTLRVYSHADEESKRRAASIVFELTKQA